VEGWFIGSGASRFAEGSELEAFGGGDVVRGAAALGEVGNSAAGAVGGANLEASSRGGSASGGRMAGGGAVGSGFWPEAKTTVSGCMVAMEFKSSVFITTSAPRVFGPLGKLLSTGKSMLGGRSMLAGESVSAGKLGSEAMLGKLDSRFSGSESSLGRGGSSRILGIVESLPRTTGGWGH
jgi:hypothetical protein